MPGYALIGDSQAAGLSTPLASRLPIVFAQPMVGWTTAHVFGQPLDAALRSSASAVIAVVGGNDDPLSVQAFDAGITKARAAGKTLIIVGPVFALTDDAVRHDHARVALMQAAERAGAPFIDAYPMTRDLASAANVHLTASRYVTYAERLSRAIKGGGSSLAWGAGLALAALALWRWA